MVDKEGLPTNNSKGYRNNHSKKTGGYLKNLIGERNKNLVIYTIISIIGVYIIYKIWLQIQRYFNDVINPN